MKNPSLASLLGLTLLLTAGCKGDNGEDPIEGDVKPWETEWTAVVDNLPFPLEGDGKVNTITIGRRESEGNYANRGNIEVLFDQDQAVITIEMKVYDFTDDIAFNGDPEDSTLTGVKERMSLLAFVSGTPAKPDTFMPEDDCTQGTWKSGCFVYTYYDGLVQPVRAGADLRVHLPKAYRGRLNVETEDNTIEASYPRLGNITIDGLCGSSDVTLSAGTANIKMCRDLQVGPTCSAAQIENCETFKDDMGEDAAWSAACMCPPDLYGQVKVTSRKPYSANITVDIPTTTWLNVTASNESADKPNDCKPVLESCVGDAVCTPVQNNDYSVSGEFNYPSPAAASGAGFNVTVTSAECGPVKFFASPDDWSAEADPEEATHGYVKVCTDCL